MPAPTIREATPDDAAQIQAIYAPIVSTTTISFELEPPSIDEIRRRILHTSPKLPWLVCERDGILGYAYASQHRSRAAYQWSVDVSVYVHEQARRMHIGRALYTALFKILALQGFFNAYAGIALPNPASVGIHESLGFVPVGVYRGVGYKLGAWHDVGWWQLSLQPRTDDPAPPRTLDAIRGSAAWDEALSAGTALIRQA
ncbi:MAG: N-acetyltransferase [Chloroflexi bacterium]|nr:N-acetyltransferase [Chloroflexota bacterium]